MAIHSLGGPRHESGEHSWVVLISECLASLKVMDPTAFLTLMLTGLGATALMSAVGLAGGTIIVPVLVLVFGIEARYAAGTTILAIFFGICSASVTYLRQGRVDVKLALLFDTLDILGVVLGSYATLLLSSEDLAFLLGCFLTFVAWRLWAGDSRQAKGYTTSLDRPIWKRRVVDKEGNVYEYKLTLPQLVLSQVASFASGIATGLFGIGGGSVDATIMMLIGVPPHLAVATSVFGMTITKSAGVVSHYFLGNVLLDIAVPLSIGAIAGGQIGPRLASRAKPELLRRALAITVLVIGLWLAIGRLM